MHLDFLNYTVLSYNLFMDICFAAWLPLCQQVLAEETWETLLIPTKKTKKSWKSPVVASYATHSAKWNLGTSAPVDFEKLFLSSAIYMQDE